MAHEAYFANLDAIEVAWKELHATDFPSKLRDDFWNLCIKGRMLFQKMVKKEMRNHLLFCQRHKEIDMGEYRMVSTVPAYQRAIMLLEHEQRIQDAINLCEEAQKWKINTNWYAKRIEKMQKPRNVKRNPGVGRTIG